MIFHKTPLPDAWLVELEPFSDDRGQFARAWCREEFDRHGVGRDFVQGNVSVNPTRGTLRGMHYQIGGFDEVKLVRCVRGALYDVIIDVRPQSPTYLRWIGVELTPQSMRMLYIPEGFAHGFQTLTDDTEANYMVSAPYNREAARGVRYDDPVVGIEWPLPVSRISAQDKSWPLLDASLARRDRAMSAG
jgi:dTDP-4-dehydrorhamnose 3,5-epimerase